MPVFHSGDTSFLQQYLREFQCHFLPILGIFSLFNFNHSGGCVLAISLWFKYAFLWCWVQFHRSLGHLEIPFVNCIFMTSAYFTWVACLSYWVVRFMCWKYLLPSYGLLLILLMVTFFFFLLFRATFMAYGGSQVRGSCWSYRCRPTPQQKQC